MSICVEIQPRFYNHWTPLARRSDEGWKSRIHLQGFLFWEFIWRRGLWLRKSPKLTENDSLFKVLVIGELGSGKTSLIKRYRIFLFFPCTFQFVKYFSFDSKSFFSQICAWLFHPTLQSYYRSRFCFEGSSSICLKRLWVIKVMETMWCLKDYENQVVFKRIWKPGGASQWPYVGSTSALGHRWPRTFWEHDTG